MKTLFRRDVVGVLLTLLVLLTLPLLAGLWLDSSLGSSPIGTLAGGLVGSFAGMLTVYRWAVRSLRPYLTEKSDGGSASPEAEPDSQG